MQPLAIVFYERIMPGSQLVNRLQDLKYRVLTVGNAAQLAVTVERESPLLTLTDLVTQADIVGSITRIRQNAATKHVPIIAFAPDGNTELMSKAQTAGAALVVGESTLSGHLETLLEQVLHVD